MEESKDESSQTPKYKEIQMDMGRTALKCLTCGYVTEESYLSEEKILEVKYHYKLAHED